MYPFGQIYIEQLNYLICFKFTWSKIYIVHIIKTSMKYSKYIIIIDIGDFNTKKEQIMRNKKPTLAQQTYEKVCAIETILNSLLADSSTPVSGPPVQERPLYLATAGPEMPLSVIRLEDAPDYLPCFDEADLLYGIPGLPILMSYCPEQVMDIGEESYLVGPMIFFRIDRDGNTVSLQVADLYQLAEFLEEHSVILMQGGESFIAIRLD